MSRQAGYEAGLRQAGLRLWEPWLHQYCTGGLWESWFTGTALRRLWEPWLHWYCTGEVVGALALLEMMPLNWEWWLVAPQVPGFKSVFPM